jgi:hypothetical protein
MAARLIGHRVSDDRMPKGKRFRGEPAILNLCQEPVPIQGGQMKATIGAIEDEVRTLKLDDSLLFLNHILSVSRGLAHDSALEAEISTLKFRPPAFIIHFLAKQLLLHASNLGHRALDWRTFVRLIDLWLALDDPIVHDPNWKHADPTGFFERFLAQQIPSQRLNPIQRYGLALGLFRDVGVVRRPEAYDLKAKMESELGVSIEQFMALGHVCSALRKANVRGQGCIGTFTPEYLAEAYSQGIEVCRPEIWRSLLPRVSCTRDDFRGLCQDDAYRVADVSFAQFEFNPLVRFPITEILNGHFVAVDPQLIYERVTFGLFYDLFDKSTMGFTNRFGHAFDQFVGQLLGSVCPVQSLWSASDWEQRNQVAKRRNHSQIGDWIYTGSTRKVLLECKSLRPTLELTTYGSDDSVQQVTARIVSALEQLIGHGAAIRENRWRSEGLLPQPTVCVVVTYGRINTINGPFTRKQIRQRLADKGLIVPPFVVLSLEELDSVVRLVEVGHALDDVVLALAEHESFDVLQLYLDDLKERAVSSLAFKKARDFLDRVRPKASAINSQE